MPDPSSPPSGGLPFFLTQLLGWYAMTILVLGQRTGLLAELKLKAGSSADLASRTGVDPVNALAWLRAMVGAGHATHKDGIFTMTPQLSAVLGGALPVDAEAILEFVRQTPEILPDVEIAMRSGAGVAASRYHLAYGEFMSHINTPTYRTWLVEDWIGGVDGLGDLLRGGGAIADLACGDGDAAILMADAFPKARVIGLDLDSHALEAARQKAHKKGITNVQFVQANASAPGFRDTFDLAVCLDSWHHLGDTVLVGRAVREALKPGGVLLVAESGYSGDLDQDGASPTSLIGYAAGLLYCVQESLAAGGSGLTPADGPNWVTKALGQAGYRDVRSRVTKSGWRVFAATR
jgi:SAM-dependent methyltransferase